MINKILSLLRYTTSLLCHFIVAKDFYKKVVHSSIYHSLRKKNIYERETQNSF